MKFEVMARYIDGTVEVIYVNSWFRAKWLAKKYRRDDNTEVVEITVYVKTED